MPCPLGGAVVPSHDERGVDLIVFVVEAECVHYEVYVELDCVFVLFFVVW